MGKVGKTLKNLLYTGAFLAGASFLPSCEPDEPETPAIEQSVALNNDVEINYSATLSNVDKAQLNVKKEGVSISTEQISDVSSSGADYQKTYTYSINPNITKGNYEFVITSDNLEKKNSVQIQNYKPTGNFNALEMNLMQGGELDIILPTPSDKNPEDNPVGFANAKSLDGKTSLTLNEYNLKIKALSNYTGGYQIELEYGSTGGGLEKSVLTGNIIGNGKILINPFVQPNDSTLNWYGSGDVNKNNTLESGDLTRFDQVVAGTFSDPSDTRLYDRADVNGDEKVNSEDRKTLQDRLNGVIVYLPGEWNKLPDREKREDWFTKMLKIDKTNEIPVTSEFDCDEHALLVYINLHGVEPKDITKFFNVYPFDVKDNGRFNIPVYFVALHYYDSENKLLRGHAIDRVVFGDDFLNPQDKCDFETETDAMYVNLEQDYGVNDYVKFWVRGNPILEPQDEFGKKYLWLTPYLTYTLKNDNYNLIEQNTEIDLITKREK